jgi:hypothetical protein
VIGQIRIVPPIPQLWIPHTISNVSVTQYGSTRWSDKFKGSQYGDVSNGFLAHYLSL